MKDDPELSGIKGEELMQKWAQLLKRYEDVLTRYKAHLKVMENSKDYQD